MARISKEQRWNDVHAKALREFDLDCSPIRDERAQCLADRRFYSIAGAQWEGSLGEQFENRPKFEVNKIMLAIIRIFNDYRSNRVTVKFVSKDGKESDELADTCASLYRATEQDSVAEEAYDNGFEEAVGGGFGAFRLRTCYVDENDEEDERQEIKIEPIYDADSTVYFDINAKRQDKKDAKHCFVLIPMSPESYEDTWNDDPSSWPHDDLNGREFDWATPEVVYVAEYFVVEDEKYTVQIWKTIDGLEERYTDDDFEDDPELLTVLTATGAQFVREKKVKRQKVHKYILSGGGILEDCGYIAGNQIPIVPVYGKRWVVDNVERCMGHVRLAKDSQRLKNMQLSKLGEISALSSIEKPILTPEQVAGHQLMWADDNIKQYPYLLVNPVTDANGQQAIMGPIGYTKPPAIPPAMAALLQITETDMQEILGNQGQADQVVSNISGKAVELIQGRLDMQSYIYMSNFAKAIKRCGEIWLSMAADVFVEEGREVKGMTQNGEAESIRLMTPMITDNGMEMQGDLSKAKFDVAVEVGPTSESKRQSTVRSLTEMMQMTQDPETQLILSTAALANIQGEGMSDINKFMRKKLVKMGVFEPTDQEAEDLAKDLANVQPDPNALYLQAAAKEAEAKAMKAEADTMLTLAKTEETKVDMQMTMAKMGTEEQNQAINAAKAIQKAVQNPANPLP
jgi:hypothetical protein